MSFVTDRIRKPGFARRWIERLFGRTPGYRPEVHYMRGPGPASRRKAGTGSGAADRRDG